jgi:hypothetical protein
MKFMEHVAWLVLQGTSLMDLLCSVATVLQVLFVNLAQSVVLQLNRTGRLSGSSKSQFVTQVSFLCIPCSQAKAASWLI